jgi:hypothetical protein
VGAMQVGGHATRAGARYQGGGKPRPYYTRAWQADSLVYSRGDPLRSPCRIVRFVAFAHRVYAVYERLRAVMRCHTA